MTTIPLLGQVIRYSDIQKAFGGKNSNLLSTVDVANSLNIVNNYTISGLSLGDPVVGSDFYGNISNVGTITATTLNNNSALTLQTTTNDIIFKTNSTEKMRILANGNIGIGTTSPVFNLDVNGSINTNEYFIKGNNLSDVFVSLESLESIRVINIRNPINETTNPIISKIEFNTNYYYYVFTNTGEAHTHYTITFNNPSLCDILVVGGGGGGHGNYIINDAGGGGGGGQVIFSSDFLVSTGIYNIYVGNGGGQSGNGYNSSFNTIIAEGGYGSTGFNGGNSGANLTSGGSGGGGGAGGNGEEWYLYMPDDDIVFHGGNGGAGVNYSSFVGTSVGHNGWFSSGGAGSGKYRGASYYYDIFTEGGEAPQGGGGNGAAQGNGHNGLANTGGGGGGGTGGSGGSGGSGVVILRIFINNTSTLGIEW